MVRLLFAHLSQVSSVTMPASFPLQLAELHQKSAAPALTFFVGWGLKIRIGKGDPGVAQRPGLLLI